MLFSKKVMTGKKKKKEKSRSGQVDERGAPFYWKGE